jgi:GET complex subunit GET2
MSATPEGAAAPTDPPKEETPGQRQARLRRERRQAKIQAEGSTRLAAITNLSGRRAPAPGTRELPPYPANLYEFAHPRNPAQTTTNNATEAATQPSVPPSSAPIDHPDPEEGDISQHHYQPRLTPRPPIAPSPGWATPQPGMAQAQAQGPPPPGNDDPMVRMIQQMMGDDPNKPLPPGLTNLLGAARQDEQAAQPQNSSSSTNVWRIVHAIVSFLLAGYIVLTSGFTGSKISRENPSIAGDGHFAQRLFLYFATVEVVLQSSRYFIEGGQLPQSGVMGVVSRVLPEPYAGYVRIAGRYSVIYSTIVADALVVIFVLGAVAWWSGTADV